MVADFRAHQQAGHLYVFHEEQHSAAGSSLAGYIVFYPRDDHMHLENVAVMPDRQGAGIGRQLIAFCEATAQDLGLGAVELYTNEKMTENLRLYPELGYVETSRRSEDGFNRVYFRKVIADHPTP